MYNFVFQTYLPQSNIPQYNRVYQTGHAEFISESQNRKPLQFAKPNTEHKQVLFKQPTLQRNYCIFNQPKVDFFVKQKEAGLPYLKEILKNSNNEEQITETLYIIDRMLDAGTRGIDKIYPLLSRFNNTNSPNIQTFLAGIYRKIQVPDAFGPLVAMLIRNAINPQPSCFDPNEEIGGVVLSYLSDRFRN